MNMLHVTGFASPLDHKEMTKFVSEDLALPEQATVVTRGYYSQRASLRFIDEESATTYLKAFKEA
eukprot:1431548-Amphidinium_carterae.1